MTRHYLVDGGSVSPNEKKPLISEWERKYDVRDVNAQEAYHRVILRIPWIEDTEAVTIVD